MRTNAPPPRRHISGRWTRLLSATALATALAVSVTGNQLPSLHAPVQLAADIDEPLGYDLDNAAQVRADQCTMSLMLRKGGQELKAVARGGLNATEAELRTAADLAFWKDPPPPLDVAFQKDKGWASAKLDELNNRSEVWEEALSPTFGSTPLNHSVDGVFEWVEDKDDPFVKVGLSNWVAERFWHSQFDLFDEDQTPLASKESVDAVNAIGTVRYSPDGGEILEARQAFEHLTWMHPMYADDARLFLQHGGFPTSAPAPDTMEFRLDVEALKSRFASCATENPQDPHKVMGPALVVASTEWQAELTGQRAQRDTILGAEANASKQLTVAAQALGEALGQSIIASRLTEWQAYWLKQTEDRPDEVTFTTIKNNIVHARARAQGRVFVAARAAQLAQLEAAKAETAKQQAYAIADAAGQPRGRGLLYGQQAVQVAKASAAAAQAVFKAAETASNATRASAADSKTLMALAETQAHASKAEFRRIAAQEAAAQAKAAAEGAAAQAVKAAENASKAKAAENRAKAAEAEAKTAAEDADAKRRTAEAEAAYAKSQKELAEAERTKAANAEATAQSQRQIAAEQLSAAQSAGTTAATKKDAALKAEGDAVAARDRALAAEKNRDALNARAAALEAKAAADEGTAAAEASRAAASEARTAANNATSAATSARTAANEATTAASNARAAATRADAAAKRAQSAADGAKADVAITEAAVKKAHAAAADAIDAAWAAKWNAVTAKALAETARQNAVKAKADAAVARTESIAAGVDAVRTAGFAYATSQAATAARDSAAQVIKPANDAIELGSPYKESDSSAGLAVLTGQAAKTLAEQQAAVATAKSVQAAKAAAEAKALAAQASADAKVAAEAAAQAAEYAAKAAASSAQAQASANAAEASAKAAQKAEANTVEYDRQAKEDAEAAQNAADAAGTHASAADAAATEAERDAASARNAATAAEADASSARGVADQAERDATTAEASAARAQEAATEAQAAASRTEEDKRDEAQVQQASTTGMAGAAEVMGVPYGVSTTASSDGFCTGTNGCDYTVDYHVTGMMLYFVVLCTFPDVPLAECIGDLEVQYVDSAPIDIREQRKVHVDGFELTKSVLEGFARGLTQDFVDCWNDLKVSACLWAAAIVVPAVIGVAAKIVKSIRAAAVAGSGMTEAVTAAGQAGMTAEATAGVTRAATTAAAVAQELEAVNAVARAHGYANAAGLGKGVLWANKLDNLNYMNAAHVAKVKNAGFTRSQVETVFKYYDKVRTVTPQNPSAGPRADLMAYILKNW
ncbi:hypothetical protein [Streptomyces sp. CB03234]|uniref:hypothetical protein n=1 Tax=Streptomyces sp. (strain CB03234) TaxID=1703937 RepID=UPI000939F9E2|nr:hypothetical protein [Streptomyces sp. CB03234]